MRGFAVLLLIGLLLSGPSQANEWECYGPGRGWCAWTRFESRPQDGWGVVNKARLPGLIVETIVDAPGNVPRLAIRVSPVPQSETARVILSLRRDETEPARWRQFMAIDGMNDSGSVVFILGRHALETLLQEPERSVLYVFAEVGGNGTNHKVSHKVTLEGLREALRFARLGSQ